MNCEWILPYMVAGLMTGLILGMLLAYIHSFWWYKKIKQQWEITSKIKDDVINTYCHTLTELKKNRFWRM